MLPRREATPFGLWSLHLLGGSLGFQAALFAVAAVFALALLLGWRARLAAFASWLLLTSLQNRNPLVAIGADDVLRLLLLWSLFLPLSARASLDARRRPAPTRNPFLSVGSATILVQVALIYPFAAVFKRREAVWQQLAFLEQAMGVEGIATDLGRQLLAVPALLPVLSWLALQLESWGVLLAFSPWRTGPLRSLAVAVFMAFHLLVIGTTFRVGLFPVVMAVAWLVFLPPWLWDRLAARLPRPASAASDERGASRASPLRSLPVQFAAGALLICVAIQNLDTLAPERRGHLLAGPVRGIVHTLRLDQHWSLWSRIPTNRHYVFAARLRDGREVDLHRGGAPLDWDRSRRRSRNNRWWKYQFLLSKPAGAHLRPLYASWLRRRWNRGQPAEARIERLTLWMLEKPRGAAPRRVRLSRASSAVLRARGRGVVPPRPTRRSG